MDYEATLTLNVKFNLTKHQCTAHLLIGFQANNPVYCLEICDKIIEKAKPKNNFQKYLCIASFTKNQNRHEILDLKKC